MKKTLGSLHGIGGPRFLRHLHGTISPKHQKGNKTHSPPSKTMDRHLTELGAKRRISDDTWTKADTKRTRLARETNTNDDTRMAASSGL